MLPDLTQLSLDNFAEQTVALLSEGYDYGLVFGTDQNDAFYLEGLMTALTSSRRATLMHGSTPSPRARTLSFFQARFMKRTMEIWLLSVILVVGVYLMINSGLTK